MHIHGEIRPLPQGVAVAAQRRHFDGQDVIVIALSNESTGLPPGQRQHVLDLFCQAVNALWDAPENHGPVAIPVAS